MKKEDLFLEFIDKKRNIYENASLFTQNRIDPEEYKDLILDQFYFPTEDHILDARLNSEEKEFWAKQNDKFLRYHKSLSVFTFLNSIAIDHYIGAKTGLHLEKDKLVIDIGGGTGHFLASFFRYPESIRYFLVDPNVRLLHDQFIRMYPKLLDLKMAHILALGENLPFKDEVADLTISSSSIDHMKDYKIFLKEASRVTRKGGKLLISSHLKHAKVKANKKFSVTGLLEALTRNFYRVQNRVSVNDHVKEFSNLDDLVKDIDNVGFTIEKKEIFKNYFYIVAIKI